MKAAAAPRPAVVGGSRAARWAGLDALRGAAMLWMLAFHFCFDLNHFGLLEPRQSFTRDAFWTLQRTAIVSLFLFCAGVGQAAALHAAQPWRRFWRRWAQVAGCAVLVTAGSALLFPQSFIYFGVLHGLAVMLVLTRLAAPLGNWLWPLGAVALALPWFVQLAWVDPPAFNWIGLVSRKPVTEDWVPLLPWLGVVLWGTAAGQVVAARGLGGAVPRLPRLLRPVAVLGRWPLAFYMLHQPVLIGAIAGGRHLGWW